ncbi:MAG: preprotein translocase subunit SecE [Bacilli bacterium]|jgi:preprotein translocase SecE subunit|nr:preprotein translocase subunit SecE [Bacilli bacterium]
MGLRKYSGEVVKEAKRVRWPKREVLFSTIVVVLVIVLFASLVLFVEDLAVGKLLGEIERVFQGFKG